MSSKLCANDVFIAQWCPDQSYFDLLKETLTGRGGDTTEIEAYQHIGRHATRALTSDQPLSDEARELYKVATGSPLVTWTEAVRWVEEQGRHEESVVFNQLYTFAWVRPAAPKSAPPAEYDRFTPKTRRMEAHENLYDLGQVALLLRPAKVEHPGLE